MSISQDELDSQIKNLEQKELVEQDATDERTYKNLLVYYMIDNQTMKAKFLWRRIPIEMRQQSEELNRIWLIVQLLIQRKYEQAFQVYNQVKTNNQRWSSNDLSELMDNLIEISRQRVFDLVNSAYSSINIQDLANMLGLETLITKQKAMSQGWNLDSTGSFLLPVKKQINQVYELNSQKQMEQLTSIVSFLET